MVFGVFQPFLTTLLFIHTSSGVIGGGIIVKSMRSGSNTRVSEKFFVVLSFLSKSCNRKNRKLIGIFKEAILSSRWRYIGKIRVENEKNTYTIEFKNIERILR